MTTTVFLMDMSDSMKAQWSQEIDFVQQSIAKMPAKNQAGVVVFGADAKILYDAKPHIGTDKLPNVVKNIREKRLGRTF